MKSPDPLDVCRLRVRHLELPWADESKIRITLSLDYEMWWADDDPDLLWEYANAIQLVRDVLARGGMSASDDIVPNVGEPRHSVSDTYDSAHDD